MHHIVKQVSTAQTSNFIILSTPRSGSNLLCSLLNSHPQVTCHGEIFNQRDLKKVYPNWLVACINRFAVIFILYKKWRHSKFKPYYGFKVFTDQLVEIQPIVTPLEQRGFRIIRLYRNDFLKKAISLIIAVNTNKWSVNSENEYSQEVHRIDPEKVMKCIKYYKKQEEIIDDILKDKPYIFVDYEADLNPVNQRERWSNHICEQLNISKCLLTSNMLPTDKRSDNQRIENFQEVFDYLIQQGFQDEVDYYNQSKLDQVAS